MSNKLHKSTQAKVNVGCYDSMRLDHSFDDCKQQHIMVEKRGCDCTSWERKKI